MNDLTYRKATTNDLPTIIQLLADDDLGKQRESHENTVSHAYLSAFEKITADNNQYLMVTEKSGMIVGTCHLSLIPSLTFQGATRLQIEGVRVDKAQRGQKIGKWMIEQAIEYGKQNDAKIIQLTTNKKRSKALSFYQSLGFETSHEGFKLYL